jgi:hypothetical protein
MPERVLIVPQHTQTTVKIKLLVELTTTVATTEMRLSGKILSDMDQRLNI